MNEHEPTLAEVAREYPDWEIWRAVSGRYLARRKHAVVASVDAEDPRDLRDQLRRETWMMP